MYLDGFHQLVGSLHAPLRQGPQQQHDTIGGAVVRVIALRHLTLVARRQQQVFATLAGVRTGQTEVAYPQLVDVVGHAHQRAGRQFHHHRTGRNVEQ
ncbi:hypothetical protein D3C80_1551590 [compost metagenome]